MASKSSDGRFDTVLGVRVFGVGQRNGDVDVFLGVGNDWEMVSKWLVSGKWFVKWQEHVWSRSNQCNLNR